MDTISSAKLLCPLRPPHPPRQINLVLIKCLPTSLLAQALWMSNCQAGSHQAAPEFPNAQSHIQPPDYVTHDSLG